jgi:NADH-quinone oxidoreductase subunit M
MLIGAIGVLYGAILAFAQTDFKRLVAYTSVSHMGFVLLGAFARNTLALQGTVMEMISHGISTGALFILAGVLQERLHTRDLRRMGGLWSVAPGIGAVAMLFAMASLGLPGLGNFVAEFLVLLGAYQANALVTVIATLGLIAGTIYALWIIQHTFHGPNREGWALPDFSAREWVIMASMILVIVWLGLYPQPVLNTARVEEWKIGRLEGWKTGRVEEWKVGRLDSPKSGPLPTFQPSNLPAFQPPNGGDP